MHLPHTLPVRADHPAWLLLRRRLLVRHRLHVRVRLQLSGELISPPPEPMSPGPARNAESPRTNEDVVADALRVERPAFEAFVRARVRPDEVDDIVQVAALRAIERADTLDDPARVVAWLYRIHRNLIIDTHRRRARERRHTDDGVDVSDDTATNARATPVEVDGSCDCSVVQAGRLKPAYASILRMIDTDGVTIRDAADRLQVTVNNATVRLHRARTALRAAMAEHCGVTGPRDCASCRCVEDTCCAA